MARPGEQITSKAACISGCKSDNKSRKRLRRNDFRTCGGMARPGERLTVIQAVGGLIPLISALLSATELLVFGFTIGYPTRKVLKPYDFRTFLCLPLLFKEGYGPASS